MSLHLDLHLHILVTKLDNPDTCPKRLVIGHPFVKVPDHSRQRLVIQRDVIGIDPEHLLPALAASLLEDVVDVGKGLVDLILNIFVDHARLVDPTTWERYDVSLFLAYGLSCRGHKIEHTLA